MRRKITILIRARKVYHRKIRVSIKKIRHVVKHVSKLRIKLKVKIVIHKAAAHVKQVIKAHKKITIVHKKITILRNTSESLEESELLNVLSSEESLKSESPSKDTD